MRSARRSHCHIPDRERVYVSIDVDDFDPSIAPGTATITRAGFTYYAAKDLPRELTKRFPSASTCRDAPDDAG
jgi:agmatinase